MPECGRPAVRCFSGRQPEAGKDDPIYGQGKSDVLAVKYSDRRRAGKAVPQFSANYRDIFVLLSLTNKFRKGLKVRRHMFSILSAITPPPILAIMQCFTQMHFFTLHLNVRFHGFLGPVK